MNNGHDVQVKDTSLSPQGRAQQFTLLFELGQNRTFHLASKG